MKPQQLQPLYMGAIISVVMCLVILSPISSAALAVALGLEGLAGGSAVVGCACSMVGFAVISYHENGIDGLLSQGIGTSKIQFGNAVKNPYIIIPTLVASFICGMLSTTFFKMECNRLGAGMGNKRSSWTDSNDFSDGNTSHPLYYHFNILYFPL